MWRCENCGASVRRGTACPQCGRPIDVAVADIGNRVKQLWFIHAITTKWIRRGAIVGLLTATILTPVFAASETFSNHVRAFCYGGHAPPQVIDPIVQTVVFFSVAVVVLPLLFGILAYAFAALIRPIIVALFCSVERFEQEYGSSKMK